MTARLTESQYTTLLASRRGLAVDVMEKEQQQKLIRQSSKGPNKIEAAFEVTLYWRKLRGELVDYYEHETIPLKLANGLVFKPDFPAIEINPAGGVRLVFFEVKGYQRGGKTKAADDAVAKIKTAAAKFRHFRFVLVWREGEEWREQEVLP